MRTRRARMLVVVTAFLVVVGMSEGVILVWRSTARHDLARARQQQSTADADVEREASSVDTVKAVLRGLRSDTALASGTASTDEATRAQLLADLDGLHAQLAAGGQELAGSLAVLESLRALVEARGVAVADLRTCVTGVLAAAAATEAGDTQGAVAQLNLVTDACMRAQQSASTANGVVFPFDFPDPDVVWTGTEYDAFATNSAGGAIQLISSTDLVNWHWVGAALNQVPSWADRGATWAPAILHRGSKWLLFYAVRDANTGEQCLSVATANSSRGPYTDSSSAPLVCDVDDGGSIDPSPIATPDGRVFLLWKTEGETVGNDAQIRVQELRADGLAVVGAPSVLLSGASGWEGRTIEAPTMVATDIGYVLLYSGNAWNRAAYATGAAVCDTVLGPCRRLADPVLATSGTTVGPGGASIFRDAAGALRVAYHSWDGSHVGYPYGRFLHIGQLTTAGGSVAVSG